MYKFTSTTNKGYDIYVNLISSPAGHYLSRRPYVIGLIAELLSKKDLHGEQIILEQDMGREIGTTDIVVTTPTDNIYYAQTIRSKVYGRFAKNRNPQGSNVLTVVADQDIDGNYEVCNVWIGTNYPAFPGDELASEDSKTFWETHALVHDAVSVQSKSVTKVCPY